jgi:hypothetical protein
VPRLRQQVNPLTFHYIGFDGFPPPRPLEFPEIQGLASGKYFLAVRNSVTWASVMVRTPIRVGDRRPLIHIAIRIFTREGRTCLLLADNS